MTSELVVPNLSKSNKTTKDQIIEIIIKEPNLTIRKIENKMKREFGHSVTYQAVRKAALQLLEEKVLNRNNKQFNINKQWLDRLQEFCNNAKGCIKNKTNDLIEEIKKLQPDSDFYKALYFENIKERTEFIVDFETKILNEIKEKNICVSISHPSKLHNLESIVRRMNMFNENNTKFYVLYGYNTILDQLAANCYRSLGANVKTGINFCKDAWFNIYGDIVLQTVVPKKLLSKEKKIYSVKSFSKLDMVKLVNEIYLKKTKIKVIIQKNKSLANKLRTEILKNF